MSPARQHQARFASAKPSPTPIVASAGGGRPVPVVPTATAPAMTPAREHRLGHAIAAQASDPASAVAANAIDPAAASVMLRLQHDLRRLKETKSIEGKVAAKRTMLPEYHAWCDAVLAADQPVGAALAGEVLPIMMVWSIDVGDWPRALELAGYVLRHDGVWPNGRYKRDPATLLVEDVADAALKLQARDVAFPLEVLQDVEALTADADMHDEVRAKLEKAIGVEIGRGALAAEGDAARPLIADAIARLRRAQELHDRSGVKDRVRKLEKALADNLAAFPSSPPVTEPAARPAPDGAGDQAPGTEQTDSADHTDTAGSTAG